MTSVWITAFATIVVIMAGILAFRLIARRVDRWAQAMIISFGVPPGDRPTRSASRKGCALDPGRLRGLGAKPDFRRRTLAPPRFRRVCHTQRGYRRHLGTAHK